jgi:hypothetical protein
LDLINLAEAGAQTGWGEWFGTPGQQSPRDGKMNILNIKFVILRITNFKLLKQKRKFIKNLFLLFVITFRGNHYDYSPLA